METNFQYSIRANFPVAGSSQKYDLTPGVGSADSAARSTGETVVTAAIMARIGMEAL